MKKVGFILFIAFILCAGIMCSCGSKEQSEGKEISAGTWAEKLGYPAGKKITFTINI